MAPAEPARALDPVEWLPAIEECRQLMAEDGAWRANAIEAVGQARLWAFFARRAAMTERLTRHVVTSIAIDALAADLAHARSYPVEIRDDRGPDGLGIDTRPGVVGDYLDELVRVEGRWLFRERRVVIEFKRETEAFLQQEDGRA